MGEGCPGWKGGCLAQPGGFPGPSAWDPRGFPGIGGERQEVGKDRLLCLKAISQERGDVGPVCPGDPGSWLSPESAVMWPPPGCWDTAGRRQRGLQGPLLPTPASQQDHPPANPLLLRQKLGGRLIF